MTIPEWLMEKETQSKLLRNVQTLFIDFDDRRKEMQGLWEVQDYMYRCANNREINATEKSRGANTPTPEQDEMAQTGSTLEFRRVLQTMSMYAAIAFSRPLPFKYRPLTTAGTEDEIAEMRQESRRWMALAEWTMKRDCFKIKFTDFLTMIGIHGNQAWTMRMHTKEVKRKVRVPVFEKTVDSLGEEGIRRRKVQDKTVTTIENWPSWDVTPLDSLWADPMIGSLQKQDCVIMLSALTMADLWKGVEDGEYDEEQVKKVNATHKWDGTTHKESTTTRMKNRGLDVDVTPASDLYLVWNVFYRTPLVDNTWNETSGKSEIWYYSIIGNAIQNGIVLGAKPNYDPDEEIPVYMVHDLPDDPDYLYHMSRGEALRSNYSVECTLKNLVIDNGALVNRPPLKEIEGRVRGTDRRFVTNQVFVCEQSQDDIEEMQVRDVTQSLTNLLEYIKNDSRMAGFMDAPFSGEVYGGRTSALESSNAFRTSLQPYLILANYVFQQFFTKYAVKLVSYWHAYHDRNQLVAITDEEYPIYLKPSEMYGEYDVVVDVIDEYEADIVDERKIDETLALIAKFPVFQPYVDVPSLLKLWCRLKKIDSTEFVISNAFTDARKVADAENYVMAELGQDAQVDPNENLMVHIQTHRAFLTQFRGIEDKYPNLTELLIPHLERTEQMYKLQSQHMAGALALGGGAEGGLAGGATPGQEAAAPISGALGAMMGGGAGLENVAGV